MIKIENGSKTYKRRRGAKVEALDGITFDLPDKGMVFILGPSGSGIFCAAQGIREKSEIRMTGRKIFPPFSVIRSRARWGK